MGPTVGVSRGVAEREARGLPTFLSPWVNLEPAGVLGELLEAAACTALTR